MSGLLDRLRGQRRASMPSIPTDEAAAVWSTASRRSASDPAPRRRRSIETWLRKALPRSEPNLATASRARSRRKRDLMRDAFVRVFVQRRSEDPTQCVDATVATSKELSQALPAPTPWYSEQSSSSVGEDADRYYNSLSYGFPPFLESEAPAGNEGDSEDGENEQLEEDVPMIVIPPVQIPQSYHKQDRSGGTMVAGDVVLFTRLAFKRRLILQSRRLVSIPEDASLDATRVAIVCNYGCQRVDGVLMASLRF